MTNEQIKDYLKKYRIDSEEQLAKHIEELKRNTIPNNEIIFSLVDLLLNEKSVLNSFFTENKKQEMFIKTLTPFFLDEMIEAPLGSFGRRGRVINYSTRHKAREEGNFHKEIVGDLEGINKPPKTLNGLQRYISELEQYKDDVITNSNRGEKETMEHLQGVKETEGKLNYELDWEFIQQMAERMSQNKALTDTNTGKNFEFALSEHNKDNSQGCSIYPSQSERSDLVDNIVKNRILVMDINYLPTECKNSSTEEERNRMEEIYKCKVLFIDTSRQNTQGMQVSHPPVFFI